MQARGIRIAIVLPFLVAAGGLPPAVHAQEHPREQAPVQIPANGLIAYSDVIDQGLPSARRAIFVYPGGQLTHPGEGESDDLPAWSPDGRTLAFVRSGSSGQSIMLVDADGSNPRVVIGRYQEDGTLTDFGQHPAATLRWGSNQSLVYGSCAPGCSFRTVGLDGHGTGPLPIWTEGTQFDVSKEGLAHPCRMQPFTGYPATLLCVYRQGSDVITRVDLDAGDPLAPYFGPLSAATPLRWMYSPDGPRVAFQKPYVTSHLGTSVYDSSGIFSIRPALKSSVYPGTDPRKLTDEFSIIACPTGDRNSPTSYQARYYYSQLSPSPDGLYFVVKRLERKVVRNKPNPNYFGCALEASQLVVIRNDGHGTVQNIVTDSGSAGQPAWQPSPANVEVIIDGGHLLAGGPDELRGLEVRLVDLEKLKPVGKPPHNVAGGHYLFEDVPAGDYGVRVALTDAETSAFDVRHGYPADEPAWAIFELKVPAGGVRVRAHYGFNAADPKLLVTNLGDHQDRLDDLAAIYYQVRRFVDWVRRELTTDTGGPVAFHAFATVNSAGEVLPGYDARYRASASAVFMGTDLSEYQSRDGTPGDDAPINAEWHEYAHHLDYHNRQLAPGTCPETSHGGYANPSTCDSLIEGIAIWLPTMLARNPDYAGITNLATLTKAWDIRIGPGGGFRSAEAHAVAGLLWDLVDAQPKVQLSAVIDAEGQHRGPVLYWDTVSIGLRELWDILGTEQPGTVKELQQALDRNARRFDLALNTFTGGIDLDGDNRDDVNGFDPLFLMHGFFSIAADQLINAEHPTYHFNVAGARAAGLSPNARVGVSDHEAFNWRGFTGGRVVPRERIEPLPTSNVAVEVRDASGRPLEGAEVVFDLHMASGDQSVVREVPDGSGALLHLELPPYFDYIPEDDGALPACDPDSARYLGVTVHARINGHESINEASFDNCSYAQAVLEATGPAALSYQLAFPADSTLPTTSMQRYAWGEELGDNAMEGWGISLACEDPEVDGFAAGCARTEYRLDGGPLARYFEPLLIGEPGPHTLEYRSVDAAGNEEPFTTVALTVALSPPLITGSYPGWGAAVGEDFVIEGLNFTGATEVGFNGTPASFEVLSDNEIRATVPEGATTGRLTVTGPDGTATSADDFIIRIPVVIDAFSPASGGPGTEVLITGSGFGSVTGVFFVPYAEAGFVVESPTRIRATVPADAASGPIFIGSATSDPAWSRSGFMVPGSLGIGDFTPASGVVGTSVTVTGEGFDRVTEVSFYGTTASFVVDSPTRLHATVPPGASSGPIIVATPDEEAWSASDFELASDGQPALPLIDGFAPASGSVGSSVVVTGANLGGATEVQFGGVSADFVVESATRIQATVPEGAGSGPIRVTTPGGEAMSASDFEVTGDGQPAQPVVSSFSPASGRVGSSVVVTGANLGGATEVQFGAVSASFVVDSATRLHATVPAGAGSGPIRVTTPGGEAASSGIFEVTVRAAQVEDEGGGGGTLDPWLLSLLGAGTWLRRRLRSRAAPPCGPRQAPAPGQGVGSGTR